MRFNLCSITTVMSDYDSHDFLKYIEEEIRSTLHKIQFDRRVSSASIANLEPNSIELHFSDEKPLDPTLRQDVEQIIAEYLEEKRSLQELWEEVCGACDA